MKPNEFWHGMIYKVDAFEKQCINNSVPIGITTDRLISIENNLTEVSDKNLDSIQQEIQTA